MVIEPGQDMSSYGPGGGDGDLPGSANNLQQPPEGGILPSQPPWSDLTDLAHSH